jgi:hypothetical protein
MQRAELAAAKHVGNQANRYHEEIGNLRAILQENDLAMETVHNDFSAAVRLLRWAAIETGNTEIESFLAKVDK